MKFLSILAQGPDTESVATELVEQGSQMQADLAVLFATHHYGPEFGKLLGAIHSGLDVRNLIGCTAESIVGPDREVESQPAAVLFLASLPDVQVMPFLLDQEDLDKFENASECADHLGVDPESDPSFVVLSDPFTFDVLTGLKYLDQAFPLRPKVGGLASGADQPGQNRLFMNEQELRQGMVGVALSGPIQIDTVVSQGCRPIGQPFIVTKARQNIIEELDGHSAYDMLRQVFVDASSEDQELMQGGLHVGVQVGEQHNGDRRRDFLIHNVIGIYEDTNLAVSHLVQAGQTVQFHIRDAKTADADMQAMLHEKSSQLTAAPTGGLLFTCNGRGRNMFGQPNHDIALVNKTFRSCQIAGFFAQGEIGPLGQETHVHGFTSSLILFQKGKC
ncbi:MAG: FIST C-terminal domain-containing protein [Planctomycetes bacterium]|nr:FIST C-terminal domain-containing protein [Planctomycetota bacterium]